MKLKFLTAILVVALVMQLFAVMSFAAPTAADYVITGANIGSDEITIEILDGLTAGTMFSFRVYLNVPATPAPVGVVGLVYIGQGVGNTALGSGAITFKLPSALLATDSLVVAFGGADIGAAPVTIDVGRATAGAATIGVSGPTYITSDVKAEDYTIYVSGMAEKTSAVTFTITVEDRYIREDSFTLQPGWSVGADSGWDLVAGFYSRTLTLAYVGGLDATGASNSAIAKFGFKAWDAGTSVIDITNTSAATPGDVYSATGKPLTVTFDPWNKFDVNRDGRVDLADVAAVSFFFGMTNADADWDDDTLWDDPAGYEFETSVPGVSRFVKPFECDVNRDGKIDIEDITQVILNYT